MGRPAPAAPTAGTARVFSFLAEQVEQWMELLRRLDVRHPNLGAPGWPAGVDAVFVRSRSAATSDRVHHPGCERTASVVGTDQEERRKLVAGREAIAAELRVARHHPGHDVVETQHLSENPGHSAADGRGIVEAGPPPWSVLRTLRTSLECCELRSGTRRAAPASRAPPSRASATGDGTSARDRCA